MQQHALGLATRFSEVINDSVMLGPSMYERRRCIRALEEMVRIGKSYVRIARPQVRPIPATTLASGTSNSLISQMSACLLAALEEDELRSVAFSCWCAVLTSMDSEDVEALLEATFFVLCQYWQLFDASTKQQATAVVENLVAKYSEVFQDTIDRLPLLPNEPELRNVSKQLSTFRRDLGDRVTFAIFSERIGHENSGVVQLALQELRDYLKSHQAYLQASALSEQPAYVVLDLVRALLDCSAKYNSLHPEICRLSAQCLGIFGCLDSNRLETRREDQQFVVVKNFDDSEETRDFVLFMLENILVGSFLSTTDTHLQGFLSYAMQELLERCEFRDAATLQGREGAARYRKWLNLKDATREILTPFLTSRYSLAPMAPQQVEYPIYHSGKPYGNWLRTFVLDLLHKGQNGFALLLFEPLRRVIRVKDLSIAEFLLPYVVLHVIVSPTSSDYDCQNITSELISVLEDGVPHNATYAQREDKKQYYEVSLYYSKRGRPSAC
jgi:serine/threonine-protein kinase ATR